MNNNRKATLSRIGRERAKNRTCPECKRGNAMGRVQSSDGLVVGRRCRWCGREVVRDLSDAVCGVTAALSSSPDKEGGNAS